MCVCVCVFGADCSPVCSSTRWPQRGQAAVWRPDPQNQRRRCAEGTPRESHRARQVISSTFVTLRVKRSDQSSVVVVTPRGY